MHKEKSSPIDWLMKKRATSSCIFPPGDLTPTGLKNVCCLSSRYRRYCRSNHRLFTSSSPPMSEVVFFIVIVRYRCNRRGYCSFDVVIIVVRIYTVKDVLIVVVIIAIVTFRYHHRHGHRYHHHHRSSSWWSSMFVIVVFIVVTMVVVSLRHYCLTYHHPKSKRCSTNVSVT